MIKDKDTLKANIIQGFGTLIIREFFLKLLAFIGQIFLARLLIPSDFGIYVIIVFLISFFSLFTDIGLSLAIIQKNEEPTGIELSSIFILKTFLSLFVIFLIWLLAPLVRFIYPTFVDVNVTMIRVFSLTLLFASVRTVPISLLERKIKYNLISLIDIFGVFMFYIVSLIGALMHLGVWSLILGTLASEASQTVTLYYIQPFFPQFIFSKNNIKKMLKFGIYIQGNSLVNVISSSIVPVIGGKINGLSSVGLLDFAFNIASLPVMIAINFGRVAFAGYSRIQKEKKILYDSICKSMSMLSIILYIFPVIILGFGNELVPLAFSSKWIPAIPALYWYSFGTLVLPIIASLAQGILVIGKSKEIFWAGFIIIVSSWVGALMLINIFGFVGIAMDYFFSNIFFCISYILIFKKSDYVFPIMSIILPKLFVALFSLLLILFMNVVFSKTLPILIVKLMVAFILYLVLMFAFVKQDSKELFNLIYERLNFKK